MTRAEFKTRLENEAISAGLSRADAESYAEDIMSLEYIKDSESRYLIDEGYANFLLGECAFD